MYKPLTFFIILILFFGVIQFVRADSLSDQVQEFLRNRIEAAGVPPQITVGDELIYASIMLPRFYERRTYEAAWSNNKGPVSLAEDLIRAIKNADREGLRSTDYHLHKIETIINEIHQNQEQKKKLNPRRLVDFDLLLTDAFLIYGSHLLSGRINPQTIDSEWFANRREADLSEVLQNALDMKQIIEVFNSLLPQQSGYKLLRRALAQYRSIAEKGSWYSIPDGPKLQKDDLNERVIALRQRLIVTGDLDQQTEYNEIIMYDDELDQAVRRFQKRHGLDVDGAMGPMTLAALNVTAADRINQIIVNLERWRWLPQDLGQRHILVNIANFELDVVEDEKYVIEMRVIVGRTYRRTPVFSDKMTYLVLNPYWHVPPTITKKDILPLVRKDPEYLTKKNIKVFQSWGADAQEIDPNTIDWSQVTAKNISYRFRQNPGPENALGRIKFMFPNQFDVYLHDTPARELFQKSKRDFSSGCIRIEKPIELAEYVLRGDPKWTRQAILTAIEKRVEQTVRLPEPIPVHLLYWTAWVDNQGIVNFRNDIYERDKPLFEALREEPPGG